MKRILPAFGMLILFVSFVFVFGCAAPFSAVDQGSAAERSAGPPDIPRLTGVNWFGFETSAYVPHGLWARDYKSMLKQMKDLGFNAIRIPWSNEMLDKTPGSAIQIGPWTVDPYTGIMGINTDLAGLTSLRILDKIIDEAGLLGLRIILDNHSRKADGYYNQTLWYTNDFTEAEWIADWQMMATRYRDKTHVVAYDLSNEPHGGYMIPGMSPAATWGFDLPGVPGSTNWKAAAERAAAAIMEIDTDVIIIIQGVQDYEGTNYWWGSNLRGVKTDPVLTVPSNRLMYSVHEYGPEVHSQDWFEVPDFPDNLPSVWRDAFWFIYEQNIAGLFIGEMGLKEESAANPASIPYRWFTKWLQFAGDKVHFTYWSWNPNSTDTGGILKDDWLTVNTIKYGLVQPYLEPVGTLPSPSPVPTPSPSPSTQPSTAPSPSVSPSPSISPSPSPQTSPLPSSPPSALAVEYAAANAQPTTNTIAMKLRVFNNGAPLSLSGIKIRYYFTGETANEVFTADHAGGTVGGSYMTLTNTVSGIFLPLEPGAATADRYVEIGFGTSALSIGGGDSIEVHLRITNPQWQNFDQNNDYSFDAEALAYSGNSRIVLLNGPEVVSGMAP